MPQVYRVVVMGLGDIAMGYDFDLKNVSWTHLSAIQILSEFKLIAAIDPNEETHKKFKEISSAPSYIGIDEFIESEHESVDIVVIASPTHLHLKHYKQVKKLNARVVLMEKPLVSISQNAQEFLDEERLGPKVVVNLFRLYQRQLNSVLSDLAGSNECRITIRYSKNITHNAIHYLSLILRHFGGVIESNKLDFNAIDSVGLIFEKATVLIQPAMPNLDDNSMVVQSSKGTLYYLNGGRVAFFISDKHERTDFDSHEFQYHMLHVYQNCYEVMNGKGDDSLELAYKAHDILTKYE